MPKIDDPGTNSTSKCSATTDVHTPNTSDANRSPNSTGGKKIRSSQHASATNVSSEKREPLPHFLVNELHQFSFRIAGETFQADDTEHMDAWKAFVNQYAVVSDAVDWEDLEERARFLSMLYEYYEGRADPFPLQGSLSVKIYEKDNFFSAGNPPEKPPDVA
jgi:hypothetical protein